MCSFRPPSLPAVCPRLRPGGRLHPPLSPALPCLWWCVLFRGSRAVPFSGYLAKMYVLSGPFVFLLLPFIFFLVDWLCPGAGLGWWFYFFLAMDRNRNNASFPEKAESCSLCGLFSCSCQKLPFSCPNDVASLPYFFWTFWTSSGT